MEKIFAANFKMNGTNADVARYFRAFPKIPADYPHTIVFCPPFTALAIARDAGVHVGAQNIHEGLSGAFTGEISAAMVAGAGAEYVILGHSERRSGFNETDAVIAKKLRAAISHNLTAILCITTPDQIEPTLSGIKNWDKIILAYEPTAAIGRGRPAAAAEIAAFAAAVKKIAPRVPLLYGGSVTEKNAPEILAIPNIDGVLVGGACLDPKKFAKICGV